MATPAVLARVRAAPPLPESAEWWYVSLPEPGATFLVGVKHGRVIAGPPYMKRQIAMARRWASLVDAWRRSANKRQLDDPGNSRLTLTIRRLP